MIRNGRLTAAPGWSYRVPLLVPPAPPDPSELFAIDTEFRLTRAERRHEEYDERLRRIEWELEVVSRMCDRQGEALRRLDAQVATVRARGRHAGARMPVWNPGRMLAWCRNGLIGLGVAGVLVAAIRLLIAEGGGLR